MSPETRIGWATLLFLAALALGMSVSAWANGAESTLAERMNLALRTLPTFKEDVAPEFANQKDLQLAELSTVIAETTPSREWAALLATVAFHESGLSLRLFRGECRPRECDSTIVKGERVFRAWSPWQQHANKHNEAVWGSEDLTVQASEAAKMLKRSFYTCQGRGKALRSDWVARTLTSYSGRRCEAQWPGLAPRLATYSKLVGKL